MEEINVFFLILRNQITLTIRKFSIVLVNWHLRNSIIALLSRLHRPIPQYLACK